MEEFLLETLWVFFIVFIIPIILFVGLYRIGKFLINLINKKFHKQFSSSWAYLLLIPLPLYFVLFFAGGCSFKYFNPQYYKFLELCKDVDKKIVVYNEDYWEIIKNRKQIKTNSKGCFYSNKLKQEICFGNFAYSKHNGVEFKYDKFGLRETIQKRYYNDIHYLDYTVYVYYYYGLFLKGDEGAGWHWEDENSLECSIMDNY